MSTQELELPELPQLTLRNGRVPSCLLEADPAFLQGDGEGLVAVDVTLADGRIAAIRPAGAVASAHGSLDLRGGQIWPCFVDPHTHLDKAQIWTRTPNPDGSFWGAFDAVQRDRSLNWCTDDLIRRMDFALRCAHAHGTVAIRTHLDSTADCRQISWSAFAEIHGRWAGRITMQPVALCTMEDYAGLAGDELVRMVADRGGILGGFPLMNDDLDGQLERMLELAGRYELDVDLHVDESLECQARVLHHLARAVLRTRFTGRVVAGHCCSLAAQEEEDWQRTLDLVAEAKIAIVSLPMCNLYLQDRVPGRTPRRRGVTLLHEATARGIDVAVGSDNVRDPFYAFGDLDMLEVLREAVRIGHLDHPLGGWPRAVTRTAAKILGLAEGGRITVGQPADLVLFNGRSFTELLARPQAERIVLRRGLPIDTTLPDYRELDDILRITG